MEASCSELDVAFATEQVEINTSGTRSTTRAECVRTFFRIVENPSLPLMPQHRIN